MNWLYLSFTYLLEFLSPILPGKLGWYFNRAKKQKYFPKNEEPKIWIHAASGEIEYALPLIQLLNYQKQSLITTYTSASALRILETEKIPHQIMPIDRTKYLDLFFNQHNPKVLLISRSDIWPKTVRFLKGKKIPIILFSAHYNETKKIGNLFKFNQWKTLDYVFLTNSKIPDSFVKFKNIILAKDTRWDRVQSRLNDTPKETSNSALNHLKILNPKRIIFASIWPEDEIQMIQLIEPLHRLGWQILIAPHELPKNRIEAAKKWKATLLSESNGLEKCIYIDRYGVLFDLYGGASLAFVGGSFKNKVHSVMEPLAHGTPVVVGPYFSNNCEAVQFMDRGYVFKIDSGIELLELLLNPSFQNLSRIELKVLAFHMQGGSHEIFNFLKQKKLLN